MSCSTVASAAGFSQNIECPASGTMATGMPLSLTYSRSLSGKDCSPKTSAREQDNLRKVSMHDDEVHSFRFEGRYKRKARPFQPGGSYCCLRLLLYNLVILKAVVLIYAAITRFCMSI